MVNGKRCKVQYRKPVTVNGTVTFIEDICKFRVVSEKGTSLIDPKDIIIIEEISTSLERHQSEVDG